MAKPDRFRGNPEQAHDVREEVKLNDGIAEQELELEESGVRAEIYTPEGWQDEDHSTVMVWPGLGAGDSDSGAGIKLANKLEAEGKRVVYMNTQVYAGLSEDSETPIKDYAELARDELYKNWIPKGGEEGYKAKTKERRVVHVGHSMGAPMAYRAAQEGDELVLAQSALFDVFNKLGKARIMRQAGTVLRLCVEGNQAMIRDAEEGIREGVIQNSLGICKAALSLIFRGKGMALKRVFDELVKGESDEGIISKDISHMTIVTGGWDSLGSIEEAKRRVSELHKRGQEGILHASSVVEDLDHVPMSADSVITAIAMAIKHERPETVHNGRDDGSGTQWAA